jgi:dTDP-4-dehydrorhamnose 3,5-epimerase
MLFSFFATSLAGCYEIRPKVSADHRGKFVKLFHSDEFQDRGLVHIYNHVDYTIARKGMIKGLHFHPPPHSNVLLVTVIKGSMLNVVVDLRKKSSSFHKVFSTSMNHSDGSMLYIPEGFAHGFLSLEDNSVLLSLSDKTHESIERHGVNWASINYKWPIERPIVSEEDQRLVPLSDCVSPF